MNNSKYEIQDSQYTFPYHHIPHKNSYGNLALTRSLSWGLEYLCYQNHILEMVKEISPDSILEIGCGDGYFLSQLDNSVRRSVGVDLSFPATNFARSFVKATEIITGSVSEVKETFNVVLAIEVIEHIPAEDLKKFLEDALGRVGDSGLFILSVPTTVLPLNKKHYRHYDLNLLKEQLQSISEPPQIERVDYVFKRPWWYMLYCKFIQNRYFSFEIPALSELAWRCIWSNYRYSDEKNGCHMVVCLRK